MGRFGKIIKKALETYNNADSQQAQEQSDNPTMATPAAEGISPDGQIETLHANDKNNASADMVAEALGISTFEASVVLAKARRLNIRPSEYVRFGCWNMSDSQLKRLGTVLKRAHANRTWAQEYLGLDAKVAERRGYDYQTHMQMTTDNLRKDREAARRSTAREALAEALGKTPEEVKDAVAQIAADSRMRVPLMRCFKYGLLAPGANVTAKLAFLKRFDEEAAVIREMLYQADRGNGRVEDCQDRFDALVQLIAPQLSSLRIKELQEMGSHALPALVDDPTLARSTAADVEATIACLHFTAEEYFSFDFPQKNVAKRWEYVSGNLRKRWLSRLNTQQATDTLNSKAQAYEALKKYYGRDGLYVTSKKDLAAFKRFCSGKQKIVKKNEAEALGRGVELIDLSQEASLDQLFDRLLEQNRFFFVEDVIRQHPDMARLNESSVNTVRVIVYKHGGAKQIHDTFLKVGRSGSFVDNGGAGGILAGIDPETGTVTTDGVDEACIRYAEHPDNGTMFKGFQLPDWEQARALALEAIDRVDGLAYVGWDLAYTADDAWVIVEGNSMTQFVAQQMTTQTGVKRKTYERLQDGIRHSRFADYIATKPSELRDVVRARTFEEGWSTYDPEVLKDDVRASRTALRNASLNGSLAFENPTTFRSIIAWQKLYFDHPLAQECCDHLNARTYIANTLDDSWVRPVLKWWTSERQIQPEDLQAGTVMRVAWNAHLHHTITDADREDFDAFTQSLAGWSNIRSKDYFYTLGWGNRNVARAFYTVAASNADETTVLCLCSNGQPRAIAVPRDESDPLTWTWYACASSEARLWRRGDANAFDNTDLVEHLGRMAGKLTRPFPFALVRFGVSAQHEYVDGIELYPGDAFIRAIPRPLVRHNLVPIVLPQRMNSENALVFDDISRREAYALEPRLTLQDKRHYAQVKGYRRLGYVPNLRNPQTYNEKLIWRSLYGKNPLIPTISDKAEVKAYVAQKIGAQYCIPTYAVYQNADDFCLADLPDRFIAKSTMGWGGDYAFIVKDKHMQSEDYMKATFARWLLPWNCYYYHNLCTTLEKARPRIIVEELLGTGDGMIEDYKIYCVNGKAKMALLVADRKTHTQSRTFVDLKTWTPLNLRRKGKDVAESVERPAQMDLMIQLAEKLAADFSFIRVDLYEVDGRIYFGELTPDPGMYLKIEPYSSDLKLGEMIDLYACEDVDRSQLP